MHVLRSRAATIGFAFLFVTAVFLGWRSWSHHKASQEKMERFAEFNRQYLENLNRLVETRDRTLVYHAFPKNATPCPGGSRVLRQPMPWDHRGEYAVLYEDIRIDCRNPGDRVVVAIGDSMTGGSGLPREKTFPALLNGSVPGLVVVNAGFAGAGTVHWQPEGALFDRVVRQNAGRVDAFFVMVGGNDVLYSHYVLRKPVDTAALRNNILKILHGIRESNPEARIYITNYPDPTYLGREAYQAIAEIGGSEEAGVLPGPDLSPLADDRSNFMPDQIHLNERGFAKAAEIYRSFLKSAGLLAK